MRSSPFDQLDDDWRCRQDDPAFRRSYESLKARSVAIAAHDDAQRLIRFARRGEVRLTILGDDDEAEGMMVVAHDAGPGIADVDLAVTEGYSTYGGLGLGLPGVRRLMDAFDITSEVGRGTTVTMTKWRPR